jgi:hypothetical protein
VDQVSELPEFEDSSYGFGHINFDMGKVERVEGYVKEFRGMFPKGSSLWSALDVKPLV